MQGLSSHVILFFVFSLFRKGRMKLEKSQNKLEGEIKSVNECFGAK
jgi:hypothetical protein